MMLYELERINMCKIVKTMFDRQLTDIAGGNLSQLVDKDKELYIMTPTLASQDKFWEITADNILVVDKNLTIIEGQGRLTREINMHMEMYQADPRIQCVIHAHPKNLMTFAVLGNQMPLLVENARYMGDVFECLDYAPATTKELAGKVYDFSQKMYTDESVLPYGALLRLHGIILAGIDIFEVNSVLERLEINAHVVTQSATLAQQGITYQPIAGTYTFDTEK